MRAWVGSGHRLRLDFARSYVHADVVARQQIP